MAVASSERPETHAWRRAGAEVWTRSRRAAGRVLDLLYPPGCLACRHATAHHDSLCPACWAKVRFIERPFCERLGTPFAQDMGAGLVSPQAMADPPVYNRSRAVARFEDGPVRQLVHRLKYSDRVELASAMGHWMARAGGELLADADVLVPVPLYRGRLIRRCFNQAALLADAVARRSAVPSDPFLLLRVKPTRPQVGLSRAQRADNVQGAFRVAPDRDGALDGRRVVLVDDVVTSGATLNAAARALLRGGAATVDALVFARVVTDA